RHRAEAHAEARLRVPDPRADDGVDAEAVVAAEGTQRGEPFGIELEPLSDELLDPDAQVVEVVGEQRGEADRGARLLREEAGVEEERPVVDGEPVAQPSGAETEEGEEVDREGIAAVGRDPEMQPVLRPRAEEERDQAMVEEIEEVGERAVALAQALDDER